MNPKTVFADLLDATPELLDEVLERSLLIKRSPERFASSLQGKILYALYQKTSTRTHLSFAKALATLGGSYVWQLWKDSNFAVADAHNEMRYVSTTADVVVARLLEYSSILELKAAAGVPLINGCCNKFHPTQAVADTLTIREMLGSVKGTRWLYLGVLNNIWNSLVLSVPRLGGHLVGLTPEVNPVADDAAIEQAVAGHGSVTLHRDPSPDHVHEALLAADIVYLDTWIDMEFVNDPLRATEIAKRKERMLPFQLNEKMYGDSNALVMHCMPVHIGYEISQEMVDHPKSVIFPQAENRMHGERGILHFLLSP